MFKIAGGIVLAIVLILVGLYIITRFIGWKEEKKRGKDIKRMQKMEDNDTREYLQALERGDKYAKQGKDVFLKHRQGELLLNSLKEPLFKEPSKKNERIYRIIGSLIAIVLVIIGIGIMVVIGLYIK